MKTYLIGYDLNKPEQNYTALIKAIEAFDAYWHHLDSTWIVKSDLKAATIRDMLAQHIDANDELLVVALTGESAWVGFNESGSRWLDHHILPN